MYPAEFAYLRPPDLDGLYTALAQHGDGAKLIAGGQSLLPMMKLRLATPDVVVDIGGARELRGQWRTEQGVRIGAATTYRELQRSPRTLALLPGLAGALEVIADQQVRARGTVGGALAHADPTADLPAILLALDASVDLHSRQAERRLALSDFITGVFATDLRDDEVLTAVEASEPPEGSGGAYTKFEQPASHFALCGVAAVLTVEAGTVRRARVAMTGVTAMPSRLSNVERALTGCRADPAALSESATVASEGIEPLGDLHAPPEYRRHLLEVATRDAVRTAAARAGVRWSA
ncbi:xanthine dehydrogenase family protein subunit M [Actinobacteria bacterium YIM 96077]|uniref:Xanthine dehydrogenase family protein subunit M n=1 Tax=Phytoactinopolyspora halophila TaxID=1981511 RepID=A0A329QSS9_9ACTN|nr:xanthine dehydrogenase family protein subunit M [Phytoactinopolyspora halophila]AYY14993.1 xanthine dehydrogenase family protein subunit M [Actinobacteria bacterium YIM 96077]RAW15450.1 xanthine dehydrogenase family protein subunit M [Phytoactinopolyspora halophila]